MAIKIYIDGRDMDGSRMGVEIAAYKATDWAIVKALREMRPAGWMTRRDRHRMEKDRRALWSLLNRRHESRKAKLLANAKRVAATVGVTSVVLLDLGGFTHNSVAVCMDSTQRTDTPPSYAAYADDDALYTAMRKIMVVGSHGRGGQFTGSPFHDTTIFIGEAR